MKVFIKENAMVDDMEVHILCQERDEQVNKVIKMLTKDHSTIWGKDNEQKTVQLNIYQILFFESIDRRTFAYTKDGVYEINHRLYDLEDILPDRYFMRISKSNIVNISKIKSVEPEEGRRLKLCLDNGEMIMISRNYVKLFKQKISLN